MTLTRGIVLPSLVATALVFVTVDSHSHSVSDTFYRMVVPEAAILIVASALLLATRRLARDRP